MIPHSTELTQLATNPIRKPTARIYVKWDGNNWTEETSYLKNVSGLDEMSGGLFSMGSSEIDASFYNGDNHFTVGHPNCGIEENQMIPKREIKVEIGFNYENINKFYGYIESYTPNQKSEEFSIHAFDKSYQLKSTFSGYIFFQNKTPTELLEWLADKGNIPPLDRDFEETTNNIGFAYFEDRSIWFLMNKIAEAEGGRIFFDADGILRFWNRNHISFSSNPIFTFKYDDYILDQPYEISDKDIKNVITIKSEFREVFEVQEVWNVNDVFEDEFKRVNAHNGDDSNDLIFDIQLDNPVIDFERPLVAGDDYVANTEPDGSGIDVTADIEIVELRTYIKGIAFRIRYNSTSGIAYFTKLKIDGQPAKVSQRINVELEEESSIARYGEKRKSIENEYIDNFDYAVSLGQTQLNIFANTLSNFSTQTLGIPWLEPGDIIATQLIPDSDEVRSFLIIKVNWRWEVGAGATMDLDLAINYAEFNKFEEDVTIAEETVVTLIDTTNDKWSPDPNNPLEWGLGSWS